MQMKQLIFATIWSFINRIYKSVWVLWTDKNYCNFIETDVFVEFGLSLLGLINLVIICTGDIKNYTLQTEMSILIQ